VAKRLVIFDCDGVLVDSEPISIQVLRDVLAEAGHEVSEARAYQEYLGRSTPAVARMIADEFGVSLMGERAADLRTRLAARLSADLQPVKGVRDMLARLANPRCLASSSPPERIELSLRTTGLFEAFSPHIFSASMVARGKPAPDLFLHAAARMGYAPERCVVVEDSPAGIAAAHAAGIPVLAFVGGSHAGPSDLKKQVAALDPNTIFDSMAELPALVAALGE
jgi:HAD superfamily hydrolase (TIGR01509 family)